MKWKQPALISTTLLLLLIAIFSYSHFANLPWSSRALDLPSVITQIKQLKQLVTVRYSIQRVIGMTESKDPFGSESILLMVGGEALAGVELAQLTPNDVVLSDGNHKALIALPSAKLFDTYLDEKQIKVWDRHVTWWTPWVPFNPDLEHKARLQALNEVRSAALSMGILDQAQRNAETAIRDFLAAFGIQVQFEKRGV
ncbi:MAG: DUF4230 domain-containing protein [Acidobacteriaceae bacterium]|nr:DUF4230 domain-containing protein [Acidobacteriaceae bacterium]